MRDGVGVRFGSRAGLGLCLGFLGLADAFFIRFLACRYVACSNCQSLCQIMVLSINSFHDKHSHQPS